MGDTPDPLEVLWDNLLSRQAERILEAYHSITPKEQVAVIDHLKRMSIEGGWHSEQRDSALAALKALGVSSKNS